MITTDTLAAKLQILQTGALANQASLLSALKPAAGAATPSNMPATATPALPAVLTPLPATGGDTTPQAPTTQAPAPASTPPADLGAQAKAQTAALLAQTQSNVDNALASPVSGLSIHVTGYSADGVDMDQIFEQPIAIGYRALFFPMGVSLGQQSSEVSGLVMPPAARMQSIRRR